MKKYLSLDFIIVFLFGFLFLLNWDKTAIHNFIIFFILCFLYLWLDKLINDAENEKELNALHKYKKILLFFVICFLLTVSLVMHIGWRASEPDLMIHDNVQQIEPAIGFLLQGKNPYVENYFKTELAKTAYIVTTQNQVILNPALFHVISLPAQFIFSAPFYLLSNHWLGFYDQRTVYLLLFIISLFAVFSFPKEKENKFILTAFYALNPLFLSFFVSGRSDVFVLSFIVFVIYLLKKKRILLSSLMLAAACASKHSAFFLVPFYYAYLWFKLSSEFKWWEKIKILFLKTWLFPIIFLLIVLPFVAWDPVAFYQDTYAYPAGSLATSYPINGFGMAVWLYDLGMIQNITDYAPLWAVQLPLSLAMLFFLIWGQKKENTLSKTVFNYALLILAYWLFARFFNDNYIGFVSQLFLLAYFI